METKQTHRIIRSFFGKHFSKKAQLRFRYWFRMPENEDEKEISMRELWEESPSTVTDKTWDDLSKLQERIAAEQIKPTRHFHLYRWGQYAAVIVIVVATVVITKWVSPDPVQVVSPKMTEFYVPYGECRQVDLPDGSSVWVNAGSLLVYPAEFTADSRIVYLTGEARFEVAKDPDKPFIVSTNYLDIRALGTVFSVEAYPGGQTTSATLEEGSVRVDTKQGEIVSSILKPDEQLVYSHQTRQISINKVEADGMSAWKDGYLIFEDASFEEVVAVLKRKYNVTINYDANKYRGRSYFVKFNPDESVEDALLILSRLIDDFRYTITGQTISIN